MANKLINFWDYITGSDYNTTTTRGFRTPNGGLVKQNASQHPGWMAARKNLGRTVGRDAASNLLGGRIDMDQKAADYYAQRGQSAAVNNSAFNPNTQDALATPANILQGTSLGSLARDPSYYGAEYHASSNSERSYSSANAQVISSSQNPDGTIKVVKKSGDYVWEETLDRQGNRLASTDPIIIGSNQPIENNTSNINSPQQITARNDALGIGIQDILNMPEVMNGQTAYTQTQLPQGDYSIYGTDLRENGAEDFSTGEVDTNLVYSKEKGAFIENMQGKTPTARGPRNPADTGEMEVDENVEAGLKQIQATGLGGLVADIKIDENGVGTGFVIAADYEKLTPSQKKNLENIATANNLKLTIQNGLIVLDKIDMRG